MKTWRIVSLISYTVFLLAAAIIFTTPLRFPDFIFFWRPMLIFFIPLVVIVLLLALRQRWDHPRYSRALVLAAILFAGLTAFGYMGLPILGVCLLALLGLFIASRALPNANVHA
jgi:hypothetical protein